LNDDVMGASIRLSELIAEVIAKSESTDPDRSLYAEMAVRLTDPTWMGVLIFNVTATVPDHISGEQTGALAGKQVVARAIALEASPVAGQPNLRSLLGIIDQSQGGDALPSGVGSLRARFSNSALTFYAQG
jgi:hypothetical protein